MGMSLGCKDKPKVAWGGERRVSSAISLYSRKCGASILLIPKLADHLYSSSFIRQYSRVERPKPPMRVLIYS